MVIMDLKQILISIFLSEYKLLDKTKNKYGRWEKVFQCCINMKTIISFQAINCFLILVTAKMPRKQPIAWMQQCSLLLSDIFKQMGTNYNGMYYFFQPIINANSKNPKWLTCSLEDLQLIEEDCLILADFMLFLWDFEAMKLVVCLLKLALVIR